jgi:hypothetical protein
MKYGQSFSRDHLDQILALPVINTFVREHESFLAYLVMFVPITLGKGFAQWSVGLMSYLIAKLFIKDKWLEWHATTINKEIDLIKSSIKMKWWSNSDSKWSADQFSRRNQKLISMLVEITKSRIAWFNKWHWKTIQWISGNISYFER